MRTEMGISATRTLTTPKAMASSASMTSPPGAQWVTGKPAWVVAHTTKTAIAKSAGTVVGAWRSTPVSLAVIATTIITAVEDPAELVRFYDDAYTQEPEAAALYARWRALGAVGKADHVIALCAQAGILPARTLEVGCGDGALLSELHRRGFGGVLSGVEITAGRGGDRSQASGDRAGGAL